MKTTVSNVEQTCLNKSGRPDRCLPEERMRVVVVDNFPELGRLTALRFIEWVQQNPGGVISLPTGKTPEHFIKWVKHYLENWGDGDTQKELQEAGIDTGIVPDMKSLYFCEMDEFYPIDSNQHNSFCKYVRNYYIDGFGMDPAKALVIDCNQIALEEGETLADYWPDGSVDLSLRDREPTTDLEVKQKAMIAKVDQWCADYDAKIAERGGIGFFLGGIGPDGHIAFNIRGSEHDTITRLIDTNYETQAAAAGDLGGIEVSGTKPVITIGLGTITKRPDCTAVIMAAGEAKAKIVAAGIQNDPDPLYPATALQKLPNAVFYLTEGAAKRLTRRNLVMLDKAEAITDRQIEEALIDLSLRIGKALLALTAEDFAADETCKIISQKQSLDWDVEKKKVYDSLIAKVQTGMADRSSTTFLHTEPHHDDIMLGYQPALVRDLHDKSTTHHFATLTSGFTAVTNECIRQRIHHSLKLLAKGRREDLTRDEEIHQFLLALVSKDDEMLHDAEASRFLRNLGIVYELKTDAELSAKCEWLLEYLDAAYPGKKDVPEVQTLKGAMREWEIETLWGAFGIREANVNHPRLGFYQGEIFTEEPTANRDVPPVVDLLKRVDPDVLTVAVDPEASGPDTHYKVLQAIAAAVRQLEIEGGKMPGRVWGYRNVWYRFHPSDANVFVPVSRDELAVMHQLFMDTFITQKEASFPSHEHDGPFSELAQSIQVDQFFNLQTLLGDKWFRNHEDPRIRAACAFVFLREMTVEAFLQEARDIRKQAENR